MKQARVFFPLVILTIPMLIPVQATAQPQYLTAQPRSPGMVNAGNAAMPGPMYSPVAPVAYLNAAQAGHPGMPPSQMAPHDPDAWDGNGPIEQFLSYMVHKTTFRLDYMLWSFDEPGMVRLGAPRADVLPNSTPFEAEPFEVFDQATGVSRGFATVPNLFDTSLRDVNGIRGTLTMPSKAVDFELSFWVTQQTGDQQQLDVFPGTNLIATSLLLNGDVSDNAVIYDLLYRSDLTSEVWGTHGLFVWNDPLYTQFTDGVKIQVRPMLGFRFVNLKERLLQTGVDTLGGLEPPRTAVIDSETNNNVYGPEFGLRAELVNPYFTLGLQPRITFGLNDFSAQVRSDQILSATEATRLTRVTRIDFTPIFEFNAYAKVHVTDNLSIHVGYDFMWLNRVTRPYNNIRYNEIRVGGNSFSDISLREDLEDFYLQGLTVGGELRF